MDSRMEKEAVFCLLARDCATKLKENIPVIESYRGFFVRSYVVVIENDSKDDTNAVLDDWESTSDGIIISHVDSTGFDRLTRIERLSICRNAYLDEIKKQNLKPEYLIVIDADVELQSLDLHSIISNAPADWTGLFANGRFYYPVFGRKIPVSYYDLYAYVPYDIDEYELNETQVMENGRQVEKLIKGNEYGRCRSAFGGIGIYRYQSVENARYAAVPHTKSKMFSHLCEHLAINRCCSSYGSLYICRSMKLLYERLSFRSLCIIFLRKCLGYRRLMRMHCFFSEKVLGKHVDHDYY